MPNTPMLSRRLLLRTAGASIALTALAGCRDPGVRQLLCAGRAPALALPAETPPANAAEALQRLLDGNRRHAAGTPLLWHELAPRRAAVAQGQAPFATIFGCVDSRVPPEIVFDAGLGDLFVIRTAGHVLDDAVLGSLEFGVAELAIPLLLVLGHERCGAVTAAVEAVENGTAVEAEINVLVDALRPAVAQAGAQPGDIVANAVRAQVELTVQALRAHPFFANAVTAGNLTIVGAHYDLDTGVVEVIVP